MKKIISVVLISIICCSIVFLPASATSSNKTVNDKVIVSDDNVFLEKKLSLDEQLETILSSPHSTEEQKKMAIEKANYSKQVEAWFSNDVSRSSISDDSTTNEYNVTRNVPYFRQQNRYYCGPATTKQTLHYITGSSPTQDTLANALGTTSQGTDGTRIVTYLNNNLPSSVYFIETPYTPKSMAVTTYRSLCVTNTPPILRVNVTSDQVSSSHPVDWYYTTDGHFMNISGQYTVNGHIVYEVTDPYIEYKSSSITNGKYRIRANAVFDSTMQHFAQHYYY